jgi:hypothetical protein
MSRRVLNQYQRIMSVHFASICSFSIALMFLSACDPAEESMSSDGPNDPECMEMGPSSTEACQREGLALATEADCVETECRTITYETTCSGSREALCLVQEDLCLEYPPDPNEICEAEGQVLATEEECAEIECQEVSSSVCGQMGQTLCRAPDITEPLPEACAERDESQCGRDNACQWLIPEPWACAEPEEILTNAGCFPIMNCREDADCGGGELCQSVAFGTCDEPGDLCDACASYQNLCLPAVSEPLPEKCSDRDETQCGGDDACRWLIPEPWACAEPEELLPNAGCFSVMWCNGDADCGEGEQCSSVAFGECDQPGDVCEACATYENLCLPAGEQE